MASALTDLARVELSWLSQVAHPTEVGSEPEAEAVRPLPARGGTYDRYSQAIRAIDKLSLFENRPSLRPDGHRLARRRPANGLQVHDVLRHGRRTRERVP